MTALVCSVCHQPIYLAYKCGLRHCPTGCPTRYLHVDAADHRAAFAEVVDGVATTGKPGSLSITLKVDTKADMILVTDVIVAKVPTVQEPRLYFRGLDGALTRDNPLQPQLLRSDDIAKD